MITGIVKAVCISEKKGTEKHNVNSVHLKPHHGIVGDAHAGDWHRQVSLLSYDKVKEFNEKGADVDTDATTIEEAADAILHWLKKGQR